MEAEHRAGTEGEKEERCKQPSPGRKRRTSMICSSEKSGATGITGSLCSGYRRRRSESPVWDVKSREQAEGSYHEVIHRLRRPLGECSSRQAFSSLTPPSHHPRRRPFLGSSRRSPFAPRVEPVPVLPTLSRRLPIALIQVHRDLPHIRILSTNLM